MFTGIVEEIGKVLSVRHGAHSEVLEISAGKVLEGTKTGDSIAVNGVCLTVTAIGSSAFSADVMPQTLRRSALQTLRPGSEVNLERAMASGGRFGGHIVSGHTDACGRVVSLMPEDNAVVARITVPGDIMKYIAEKGSLIPHTRKSTTLGSLKAGDPVNVEVDMLARYIERLLVFGRATAVPGQESGSVMDGLRGKAGYGGPDGGGITEEFLRKNGF